MLGLLVAGDPVMLALGCVLFHILSVLDGTDGELARVKFESTDWGARLDTAVDMATNLLFVIGLNIGLFRIYGVEYQLLGQLLVFGGLLFVLSMMLLVRFGPGGGSFDILGRAIDNRIQDYPRLQLVIPARKLFKRDFYALFFAVLGALGLAKVIPWFLLLGIVASLSTRPTSSARERRTCCRNTSWITSRRLRRPRSWRTVTRCQALARFIRPDRPAFSARLLCACRQGASHWASR